eukprot:TRINITY_DN4406_c0_g1_i6.p1 TRINITY_DN4406_c0_g1~~TRINITY_DN4406_c0_g1_i6.p1  ORF type:complete len:194 (-),score=41.89 TRINITY_DN4406_c0_g1_i6:85-666(-)
MSHAKQQQQHECMHYYARQWIRAHTREQPTADIATRAAAFMQAFPYDLRPFAAACCPCTASAVEAASAGECALSSGEAACGLSLLLCNEWGRIIQRHLPGTADEQPAGEVSPEPPVKKRMVCADGTRQEQQFRVTAVKQARPVANSGKPDAQLLPVEIHMLHCWRRIQRPVPAKDVAEPLLLGNSQQVWSLLR